MSDRLPLNEVGSDEAIARITYQIILADYQSYPELYETPTMRLLELASSWSDPDYSPLHEQITLAALWVANGGTVATWLRARIVLTTGRAAKLMRVGRSSRR